VEKGPVVDGERQNRCREDRQNCKNQKTQKTNREEQYREILKQIQGNPAKTKTKENQNKNNTKETKDRETKEKHKTKGRTINRRRLERDLAGTQLRKVVMGE
jgi:hypothetical protein